MAEKISKEDLHLDWDTPAAELKRVVRLGRAWTTFRGKRLTVLDAALGPDRRWRWPAACPARSTARSWQRASGSLVLQRVQPESRSPMSADEWLRGVRPAVGERLGTD